MTASLPLPVFTTDISPSIVLPSGWATRNPAYEAARLAWWHALRDDTAWLQQDGIEVKKSAVAGEFEMTAGGYTAWRRQRDAKERPELEKIARGVLLGLEQFTARSAVPAGAWAPAGPGVVPDGPGAGIGLVVSVPNDDGSLATSSRRPVGWCRRHVASGLLAASAAAARLGSWVGGVCR